MPVVTEKKYPFTTVVDKKLFKEANKARKALGLTWPAVLTPAFELVINDYRESKLDRAQSGVFKKKKQDMGF